MDVMRPSMAWQTIRPSHAISHIRTLSQGADNQGHRLRAVFISVTLIQYLSSTLTHRPSLIRPAQLSVPSQLFSNCMLLTFQYYLQPWLSSFSVDIAVLPFLCISKVMCMFLCSFTGYVTNIFAVQQMSKGPQYKGVAQFCYKHETYCHCL